MLKTKILGWLWIVYALGFCVGCHLLVGSRELTLSLSLILVIIFFKFRWYWRKAVQNFSDVETGRSVFRVFICALCLGGVFELSSALFNLWPEGAMIMEYFGARDNPIMHNSIMIELGYFSLFILGYLIQLRYAAAFLSGGVLVRLVFIPIVILICAQYGEFTLNGKTYQTAELDMDAYHLIFYKPVGVGAKAMVFLFVIGYLICNIRKIKQILFNPRPIIPENIVKVEFGIILAFIMAMVISFAIAAEISDNKFHFIDHNPETNEMESKEKTLPAPQANMIAAVAKELLNDSSSQPYVQYAIGGIVVILCLCFRVNWIFIFLITLGADLTLRSGLAVLLGGLFAWLSSGSRSDEKTHKLRTDLTWILGFALMAGSWITGLIIPMFKLSETQWPIRFFSVGIKYELEEYFGHQSLVIESFAEYYDRFGVYISFATLLVLGLICHLLINSCVKKSFPK